MARLPKTLVAAGILAVVRTAAAAADQEASCRTTLKGLEEGRNDFELAALCRSRFPADFCRNARQALGARPWPRENLEHACAWWVGSTPPEEVGRTLKVAKFTMESSMLQKKEHQKERIAALKNPWLGSFPSSFNSPTRMEPSSMDSATTTKTTTMTTTTEAPKHKARKHKAPKQKVPKHKAPHASVTAPPVTLPTFPPFAKAPKQKAPHANMTAPPVTLPTFPPFKMPTLPPMPTFPPMPKGGLFGTNSSTAAPHGQSSGKAGGKPPSGGKAAPAAKPKGPGAGGKAAPPKGPLFGKPPSGGKAAQPKGPGAFGKAAPPKGPLGGKTPSGGKAAPAGQPKGPSAGGKAKGGGKAPPPKNPMAQLFQPPKPHKVMQKFDDAVAPELAASTAPTPRGAAAGPMAVSALAALAAIGSGAVLVRRWRRQGAAMTGVQTGEADAEGIE